MGLDQIVSASSLYFAEKCFSRRVCGLSTASKPELWRFLRSVIEPHSLQFPRRYANNVVTAKRPPGDKSAKDRDDDRDW